MLRFFHESNTFAMEVATMSSFSIRRGPDALISPSGTQSCMQGFVDGAAAEDMTLVGLMAASTRKAPPTQNARDLHPAKRVGLITSAAYTQLSNEMGTLLRAGAPWDGVLIGAHGAAVSEQHLDCDGAFCAFVRKCVGHRTVIGVCLDMHANISPMLIDSTDVCVVWQTTPHVDMHERGRKTAELVARAIRGEITPRQWIEKPPLVVNVTKHYTDVDPMLSVCADAMSACRRTGILDASVALGSPYADVPHMGMSFVVIADGNLAAAREVSDWMAKRAWNLRAQLCLPGPARAYGSDVAAHADAPSLTTQEAVQAADWMYRGRKSESDALADGESKLGPVLILDVGDNIGGGSPGDSTLLLSVALDLRVKGFLQSLADPEAVAVCVAAGIGGFIEFAVGGKSDSLHGSPIVVAGVVTSLSDGDWVAEGPVHGGRSHYCAGICASVLVAGGDVTLALTSKRCDNSSRGLYTHLGIDPEQYRVVVAKGVESPRATFEPIVSAILTANTPGITSAEMTSFPFRLRRIPLYPFELGTTLAPHSEGSP